MKYLTLAFVLLSTTAVFAQRTFDIKDASKFFDVKVKVEKCDDMFCEGKTTFSFYKKGGGTPYQVINLPDTQIDISNGDQPSVNVNLLYDQQSVINVDDYNFDGMEDISLCDGANGSYHMPSYRIYLSDRRAGKFVYSPAFTKLGSHLGMFTIDKKKKTLETFDKSGCCWHITERYDVVANRPRKVFELVEDATIPDEKRVKITTKILVNGRWKTSVKYVKREE
jgi:hypothetical protein